MSETSNLSFIDGAWQSCGCGGKPKKKIALPPNSKPVLIKSVEKMIGPETGIEYAPQPHQVSLDVHEDDAAIWLKSGIAKIAPPGYKGRFARTGRVHAKKE